MDELDPIRAPTFRFIKKNFGPLLGGAIGAVTGAISAGRAAHRQALLDRASEPFPGVRRPSIRPMAYRSSTRRPLRRRFKRSYRRKSYRKPMSRGTLRIVRTSGINSLTITSSGYSSSASTISLNAVKTSDLTPTYRLYRIRKVVLHLVPRVDTSDSGVVNNFNAFIAAACNPEGTSSAPANMQDITAFDNSYSKWITSGDRFTYSFVPKVVNEVAGNGGTASASGSYGLNPWLMLTTTGITIPHQQLLLAAQVGAQTTLTYDYFYDIHFDVSGMN